MATNMIGVTRPHEGESYGAPDAKRARYEGGTGGNNTMHMSPSPVVHVRNVPEFTQPPQLAEAFQPYGVVNYILQMSGGRQALVEFENVDSAVRVVSQSVDAMFIGTQQVYVNYSKSQSINRSRGGFDPARGVVGPSNEGGSSRREQNGGASGQPTHILFMTVANAQFPITTDVIHQICSPYGPILRIVIIRRQMPQCLVEFQAVDAAARAAASLHGADIYSGCCTLSVEFSSTPTLNVRRNDDTTMDYTNEFQQNQQGGQGQGQYGAQRGGFQKPVLSATPTQHNPHFGGANGGYGQQQRGAYGAAGFQAPGMHGTGGGSVVLMIYNLDPSMDPAKLYNLLCIYGNVVKIKFLVRKQGTAMVEFQDPHYARTVKENLAKTTVCGKEIDIHYSKATSIGGSPGADTLENGSEAFVAYEPTNPGHRFRRGPGGQVYRPSNTVFFSNAPPGCTMELLQSECLKNTTHAPVNHVFFAKDQERKASGLIEYASIVDATNVIVHCNNITIKTDKGLFTVKLNFSGSKAVSRQQDEGAAPAEGTGAGEEQNQAAPETDAAVVEGGADAVVEESA